LVVVGLGVGGGEVVEEGVEDVVRGWIFGEVLSAERGGHAGRGAKFWICTGSYEASAL
jgi:hypothetical protein